MEKPAYENEYTRILRKAKFKSGITYSILDPEYHQIYGNLFLPTWDGTDHLHFVCGRCRTVADILEVNLRLIHLPYLGDATHALYFYLGCPECGATGQRKVYLDPRDRACKFQHTYDSGEVFVYGESRKPASVIKMQPPESDASKAPEKLFHQHQKSPGGENPPSGKQEIT